MRNFDFEDLRYFGIICIVIAVDPQPKDRVITDCFRTLYKRPVWFCYCNIHRVVDVAH